MVNTTKTKKNSTMDMLTAVEHIMDCAKDSQLSAEFYRKANRYIRVISNKLGLTREQSVMMALFIDQSNDSNILASDLVNVTGCRTTRLIRYTNDIDELVRRGLVVRKRSLSKISYRVPLEVVDAFKLNVPFSPKKLSGLTCPELFDELANIVESVDADEMDNETAHNRLCQLLYSNEQLLFVQTIRKYDFADPDYYDKNVLILLLVFCHLFVNNNDDMIGFHDIDCMFSKADMRTIRRGLERGYHTLQETKLVEFSNNDGMGARNFFRLTMKAKRELLDELQLPSLEGTNALRNMLKAADIKPRVLYYSEEINKSIDDLTALLDETNYINIRERMLEQGFRCGFTCLFYGAPGTGKTETVLQLARRTGRDIMQVNIAELKSCWVGESEKNIKALFDTYRQRVGESRIAPILLFNEADAIIGRRQEGAERAVDKMENSLQNIILQEMETLDGILIATTNLAQNMDKAFERRFLYKIRFDKPTVEARTAIWREMMPTLDVDDAKKLAERYDFSGGQIENIARHYAIDTILHGSEVPTFDTLATHCDQERLLTEKTGRIGFSF